MVTFQERHPVEHIVGFIVVILLHIVGIWFLIWMMHSDHEVKADMQPMQVQVVETSSAASAAAAVQPPTPEMIMPPTPEIEPPPINTEAPPQPKPPPKPKKTVKKAVRTPTPAAEPADNSATTTGTTGQGGSPNPGVGKPDRSAGSRPINGAQMIYPPDMEEAGKEGRVTLACDIETSGATSNCRVVSSRGGNSFVAEAMRYVKSARYRPATKNGAPIKELGHNLTVTFKLGG